MVKHLLWLVAAFLVAGSVTSRTVWCAEPVAQPVPVRVKAYTNTSYRIGLPLRVTVEITNTSLQTVETFLPSSKRETIGATLQREGSKEVLIPTIHRDYFGTRGTVQFKLGRSARAQLDLSMMFNESLPVGRYVCRAYYLYGKSLSTLQTVWCDPVRVVIEEPKAPPGDDGRDLRRQKTLYLAGLVLMGDDNKPSREAALRIFDYTEAERPDTEYGKASAFYKARLEQDPKSALTAWLSYTANPAKDAPEMMEPNDIWLIIGRLYYETGNLKAAQETLLKISEPTVTVQDYLQRIEKASATQ